MSLRIGKASHHSCHMAIGQIDFVLCDLASSEDWIYAKLTEREEVGKPEHRLLGRGRCAKFCEHTRTELL
jgi:hypothetical protein